MCPNRVRNAVSRGMRSAVTDKIMKLLMNRYVSGSGPLRGSCPRFILAARRDCRMCVQRATVCSLKTDTMPDTRRPVSCLLSRSPRCPGLCRFARLLLSCLSACVSFFVFSSPCLASSSHHVIKMNGQCPRLQRLHPIPVRHTINILLLAFHCLR